jgi:hypothetical protein
LLDLLDQTERNWSFGVTFWNFVFVYGVLILLVFAPGKKRLTAPTTLGFLDVLGFLIGLFGSFREEFREKVHIFFGVYLFPLVWIFVSTGTEPDRQVDPLERKHPYFLPCPLV